MAVLLKADGTDAQPIADQLTLETMQQLVGGYVEFVTIDCSPDGAREVLIVNEEGLLRNLPPNAAASTVAGQRIVGDAIHCRVLNEGQDDEAYV